MLHLKNFRLTNCLTSMFYQYHISICRCIRTISRRGIEPKLVKGEVRTIDDGTVKYRRNPSTYDDFVKEFKNDSSMDVLDIEKDIAMDCEFGNALIKSEEFYAMHESEVASKKSFIKKDIIQRKYFKLERETNLLTYAAKEQIRYLHKMNPTEWTPEVISERFPISVKGVKKLLRSNFNLKTSERITQHDAEVAKKWDILKSGKYTSDISPLTQRLWVEGKLAEDNYRGNLQLPSKPITDDRKIIENTAIHNGEYSSIIKKYIEFKQRSSPNYEHNIMEKQLCKKGNEFKSYKKDKESKYIIKLKYAPEEIEEIKIHSSHRKQSKDEIELQHGQFKENLLQKKSKRHGSQIDDEYQKWIERQSKEIEHESQKTSYNKNVFAKIEKYEKPYQDHKMVQYDNFIHNGKHNFLSSKQEVKKKIHIPKTISKRRYSYRKGNCVYDDDGELLFKLPY